VIRSGNKATRTDFRLEDKIAAFREIWDKFIGLCQSLYLVVQLSASMNNYFHSEEEVDSGNTCRKTQSKVWNKNLDDV
jgi:hypothetical protein